MMARCPQESHTTTAGSPSQVVTPSGHHGVVTEPSARQSTADNETGRLEAFSDGVMAVIITLMAFELKAPAGGGFNKLGDRLPELLVYVLSFIFIGIYWNNHHHLLRAATHITGAVMWLNLHLLLWLSLIPVVTEWMAANWRDHAPAASYAVVALGSAAAYTLLQVAIIRADGPGSVIADRVGSDRKGRASIVAYVAALGLAFVNPVISYALFVLVALIWFIPDRRLDRRG
jgi:uncharacterized membrane protein